MQYELPNGYLSASSIGTLLTCPRMFELKYIQRILTPPSIAQVTGTTLHRTFEEYYRTAMTSAHRYTPNQVKDLAVTMLEDTISTDECYVTADEQSSAMDTVQDLAACYVEHVAGTIMPLAVEEQHVWLARCGVPMLAYIDLRHQLPDGGEGIIDYKVTTKRWTPDKLANSLQFNLYSLVTGLQRVEVHNLVKTAPAKRSAVKQAYRRSYRHRPEPAHPASRFRRQR